MGRPVPGHEVAIISPDGEVVPNGEVGEIAVPGGFSGSGDLIRMANLEDLRGQVDITESDLSAEAL